MAGITISSSRCQLKSNKNSSNANSQVTHFRRVPNLSSFCCNTILKTAFTLSVLNIFSEIKK